MNEAECEALSPGLSDGSTSASMERSRASSCRGRTTLEKTLATALFVSILVSIILGLALAAAVYRQKPATVIGGLTEPWTKVDPTESTKNPLNNSKIIEDNYNLIKNDSSTDKPEMIETHLPEVAKDFEIKEEILEPVPRGFENRKTENLIIDVSTAHNHSSLTYKLDSQFRKKVDQFEQKFSERFPRDDGHMRLRHIRNFLPRPLTYIQQPERLGEEEKISEILHSLDLDENGSASAWELHDWMIWVEKIVHQHIVEDQWDSLGLGGNTSITWSDYLSRIFPIGAKDPKSKRRVTRERRRWRHADRNGDNELTKFEFRRFLFPELSDGVTSSAVIVHEAHEALDTDYDGRVSQEEFLAVHDGAGTNRPFEDERPEAVYFRTQLDSDQSGFLDVEEISKWVEPTGFVQAKSEVVYLMQKLDADNNKELTLTEILAKPKIFLRSQVTFFGQVYKLKNLRSEVFRLA